GGERRGHPRQCGFADETGGGARKRGAGTDSRRRRQPGGRARRAAEDAGRPRRKPGRRPRFAVTAGRLRGAMSIVTVLWCVAGLLGAAVLALAVGRRPAGSAMVYGLCLVLSVVALATALAQLLGAGAATSRVLPLGLPWLGAHFRID